jgi:tripartite-type tricarboxylate transporter receptor subunit TctC
MSSWSRRGAGAALTAAMVSLLSPRTAPAQAAWPTRPIRLVVPFSAGGTSDILARLVAVPLSAALAVPVVVENRTGAGGNVAAEAVARSNDGHTFLVGTPGTQVINPLIFRNPTVDPDRDLSPVVLLAAVPNVVVVPPSLGVATLQELLALGRRREGGLMYVTPGVGGTVHLASELLRTMTSVPMTHVPYRGSAPALADLIAGRGDLSVDNLPSALPHIQSGRLRALATTGAHRAPALPDVPTVREAGLTDYEASAWFCLAAPATFPRPQAGKVAEVVDAYLCTPAAQARLLDLGAQPLGGGPDEMARLTASERGKWQAVVAAASITAE